LITRASVLDSQGLIRADDLRPWLMDSPSASATGDSTPPPERLVGMNLEAMERRLIESTLEHFQGHRAQTAHALGIGIRTLTNKLRAYGYAPRAKSFARAG
jgi:DNA-binding NtrC family response regulator